MSRKEPTPGIWSWYWRIDQATGETDCRVVAQERPGAGVSVCRAPRYANEQQWEADAPLLASAKDLLAACEAALPILEHLWRNETFEGANTYTQMKAAIAKTKGGKVKP